MCVFPLVCEWECRLPQRPEVSDARGVRCPRARVTDLLKWVPGTKVGSSGKQVLLTAESSVWLPHLQTLNDPFLKLTEST